MLHRDHWAGVFRWSTDIEVKRAAMLSSGLGLAGPMLLAAAMGHPALGPAAAAGSLMVGGADQTGVSRSQGRAVAERVAAAAVAWGAGILAAEQRWLMYPLLVLLAALAAVLGGYSRPMAAATTRFILALIITVNLTEATPHRLGLAVLMMAGALWAVLLSLLLDAAARAYRRRFRLDIPLASAAAAPYTAAQRRARWTRSLRQLSGWTYPLRLAACLALAEAVAWGWPGHHAQWIALTVVLLSRREVQAASVRSSQRALGTMLGVIAASLLVAWRPPVWGLAGVVGLLGAARPFLNARNYLL